MSAVRKRLYRLSIKAQMARGVDIAAAVAAARAYAYSDEPPAPVTARPLCSQALHWQKPLPIEEPPPLEAFSASPTALHEAAHAVVALALGAKVTEAVLKDGGGYCRSETFDAQLARGVPRRQAAMNRAITALAGGQAAPETSRSASDRQHALNALAELNGGPETWREAEKRAAELLVKHRKAIRRVALALDRRRRLTGQQISNIVKGWPLNAPAPRG